MRMSSAGHSNLSCLAEKNPSELEVGNPLPKSNPKLLTGLGQTVVRPRSRLDVPAGCRWKISKVHNADHVVGYNLSRASGLAG
jgi:hypothetical protein